MFVKQRNRIFDLKIPKGLKLIYVWGKGLGLFADKNFKKGDVVLKFKADIVDAKHASPEAVRIGEHKFLDTKWLVPEAFINHSCSPNTTIDVKKYRYTAIKNIRKNEEVTFDYLTTEYDMKKSGEDFKCECGSRNCYGQIKGFKYLTRAQKLRLKPYLSSYILKKFQQEKQK